MAVVRRTPQNFPAPDWGFRHMSLRVARGLFRLWLVLSVLWIGGVGITT